MVHVVLYIPVPRYATSFVHGTISKDSEVVWMRHLNQRRSQEPFQAEQSATRCARADGPRGRRGACRARSPESVSDASVIDVMKLCTSVGVEAYTFGPFQEKNIHSNIDTRGACLFSIVGFFILRPLPRPSSFRSFSSKPAPAPSPPCTTPTATPSGPGCVACPRLA